MRAFVRHPSDIPMAMKVAKESGSRRALICDVSMAGLCVLFYRIFLEAVESNFSCHRARMNPLVVARLCSVSPPATVII
jgi:hypothetical protein